MGYQPVTLEELLLTPEVQNASRAEMYPESHIVGAFSAGDKNLDGLICYRPVANDDDTHFIMYCAGSFVDNHAGPKKRSVRHVDPGALVVPGSRCSRAAVSIRHSAITGSLPST